MRAAAGSAPLLAADKAMKLRGARGLLSGGLAHLLAGNLRRARMLLTAAARSDDASAELAAGAMLAGAVAAGLAGLDTSKLEAERASEQADHLGLPWLARMGQAVLALSDRPDGRSEAAAVRLVRRGEGDPWGACLAALLEGIGGLKAGESRAVALEDAACGFARLGARTLEIWCLCARALVLATEGDPRAHAAAQTAERSARSAGMLAPQALAFLALARTDPERAAEFERWARAIADECGLALPAAPPDGEAGPQAPSRAAAVTIRCFGGFALEAGGEPVDLSPVKPRARKLLHVLAVHADRSVHREVLIEELWPGTDPEVGARNLHVALSSLRQLLQAEPCSGAIRIAREGTGYRLVTEGVSQIDVVEFASQLDRGRRYLAARHVDEAIRAYSTALDLHIGDLLPEEGPDEWVLRDRESFRGAAVDAARTLAGLLLREGNPPAAARACERGLGIDRHRDSLWRALQQAHEAAGNRAAAADARRRYERILADLGVGPEHAGLSGQN